MGAAETLSAYIEPDTADYSTPEGKEKHIQYLQSLLVMIRKAQDILHEEKDSMDSVRKSTADMDLTRDGQWTGNYEEKAEEGRENLLNVMKDIDGKAETLLLEIEAAAQKIRQELENCRNMAAGDETSDG